MNNKGFAVSIVLYASATIMVLVLILILSVLSTNNKNVLELGDMVKEQVSGVTGDKYQLYNLISNSSFENDATSWSTDMMTTNNRLGNQVNLTVSRSGGKSLYISPRGWQYQKVQGVSPGDKIYLGFYGYITAIQSGNLSVWISYNSRKAEGGTHGYRIQPLEGNDSMNHVTSGFERVGAIVKIPNDPEVFVQVGSGSTNNVTAYVDDIVVVNLTKVFGSGREPSLGWCNSNIKYFNGVTTITVYDDFE